MNTTMLLKLAARYETAAPTQLERSIHRWIESELGTDAREWRLDRQRRLERIMLQEGMDAPRGTRYKRALDEYNRLIAAPAAPRSYQQATDTHTSPELGHPVVLEKMMRVEAEMAQYAEYRDARVIALQDCSCYLTDTVEAVNVTVLLETGQILNIFNTAKDDGKEYFIVNRVNEDPFYMINTWQDFLPSVDVLEWAQATGRMVRCEGEE